MQVYLRFFHLTEKKVQNSIYRSIIEENFNDDLLLVTFLLYS